MHDFRANIFAKANPPPQRGLSAIAELLVCSFSCAHAFTIFIQSFIYSSNFIWLYLQKNINNKSRTYTTLFNRDVNSRWDGYIFCSPLISHQVRLPLARNLLGGANQGSAGRKSPVGSRGRIWKPGTPTATGLWQKLTYSDGGHAPMSPSLATPL